MNSEQKAALIIFVKNPKLGKVKTRLAESIGNQEALDVYLQLLAHTRGITSHIPVQAHVFYSDYVDEKDIWENAEYFKHQQRGANLGDRMQNAFMKIFDQGYQKAVIIGSDCFEIEADNINKAFDLLEGYDAVIGPAMDGGYYLLGMSKLIPAVFENKKWSTQSVFEDTIRNLQQENMSWQELPILRDIDTEKDWDKYKA
ncbi:MAG: TIGR04282 family arsenosugar biosynthesis glycosyltransferase [Balneolales bacterium]